MRKAKNVARSAKEAAKFFLAIFVKRPIKPQGKLVQTQKTDCKNLFLLLEAPCDVARKSVCS